MPPNLDRFRFAAPVEIADCEHVYQAIKREDPTAIVDVIAYADRVVVSLGRYGEERKTYWIE